VPGRVKYCRGLKSWSCKCPHRFDDLRRGRTLSANVHSGNVFKMGEDVWFGTTPEGAYRRCCLTELRSVSESLSKVDQLAAPDKFRPLPVVERARNILAISQMLRECERIRDPSKCLPPCVAER
jgi:hypothetical protein